MWWGDRFPWVSLMSAYLAEGIQSIFAMMLVESTALEYSLFPSGEE